MGPRRCTILGRRLPLLLERRKLHYLGLMDPFIVVQKMTEMEGKGRGREEHRDAVQFEASWTVCGETSIAT